LEHATERMLFSKCQGTSLTLEDWQLAHEETHEAGRETDIDEAARHVWNAVKARRVSYGAALQQIEMKILTEALAAGQSRREIAGWFNISERNLYRKLRQLQAIGLPPTAA